MTLAVIEFTPSVCILECLWCFLRKSLNLETHLPHNVDQFWFEMERLEMSWHVDNAIPSALSMNDGGIFNDPYRFSHFSRSRVFAFGNACTDMLNLLTFYLCSSCRQYVLHSSALIIGKLLVHVTIGQHASLEGSDGCRGVTSGDNTFFWMNTFFWLKRVQPSVEGYHIDIRPSFLSSFAC